MVFILVEVKLWYCVQWRRPGEAATLKEWQGVNSEQPPITYQHNIILDLRSAND